MNNFLLTLSLYLPLSIVLFLSLRLRIDIHVALWTIYKTRDLNRTIIMVDRDLAF